MKKTIILFFLIAELVMANSKIKELRIAGPMGAAIYPMLYIVENNMLKDIAQNIKLKVWKNPDELRALTINGKIDFTSMPLSTALNLYRKKKDIRLLNIFIWGSQYIISSNKNIKNIKDLKNKKLLIPFRGDMMDMILRTLLKKNNINLKNIKISYISNPIGGVQMLLTSKIENMSLMEPIATTSLLKSNTINNGVTLYRAINLQEEWIKVFGNKRKIPMSGVVEVKKHNSCIVQRFNEEYKKATTWCKKNPKKIANIVVKYFPFLDREIINKSILNIDFNYSENIIAKKQINFFLTSLKNNNLKNIKISIPDDNFYYKNNK